MAMTNSNGFSCSVTLFTLFAAAFFICIYAFGKLRHLIVVNVSQRFYVAPPGFIKTPDKYILATNNRDGICTENKDL